MEHAAAVGVGDDVANVDEPAEELRKASARSPGWRPGLVSAAWKVLIARSRSSPSMNRIA